MSDHSKKRKKSYYIKAAKGKRARHGYVLEAGLRGFFITCNNREKEAVREAYNLLNEYADDLVGPEQVVPKDETQDEAKHNSSDDDEEEDIAAALQKEVASIKNKAHSERRFQVVDSGATNCVFIRTTVERPDKLLHALITDMHDTRKCKSRFIMRMMPVVGTCRVDQEKIKNMASEVLPTYFGTGDKYTYCVLTKIRNNNSIGKQQIIPILRDVIQELNPTHGFDPDDPDFVISMDVVKSVCCMSVMKDFYKFRKYNLQEVVKDPPTKEAESTSAENIDTGNGLIETKEDFQGQSGSVADEGSTEPELQEGEKQTDCTSEIPPTPHGDTDSGAQSNSEPSPDKLKPDSDSKADNDT